jgi:hypothetical protein
MVPPYLGPVGVGVFVAGCVVVVAATVVAGAVVLVVDFEHPTNRETQSTRASNTKIVFFTIFLLLDVFK